MLCLACTPFMWPIGMVSVSHPIVFSLGSAWGVSHCPPSDGAHWHQQNGCPSPFGLIFGSGVCSPRFFIATQSGLLQRRWQWFGCLGVGVFLPQAIRSSHDKSSSATCPMTNAECGMEGTGSTNQLHQAQVSEALPTAWGIEGRAISREKIWGGGLQTKVSWHSPLTSQYSR